MFPCPSVLVSGWYTSPPRAPSPSIHSRYIPDTYPTHTRYIRISHEYPAYTPRILHPKDSYERQGTNLSKTVLLARFLCVIFIMYNYYPHSIIIKQPMEIGRGFQHAHNSVKMCAVTHGHSPGGGGVSRHTIVAQSAPMYVTHHCCLSFAKIIMACFFMYSKNNINQ